MSRYDIHNHKMKALVNVSGKEIEAIIEFDYVGREVYINRILYKGTDIKSIIGSSVEADLEELLYKTFGR